MANWIKGAIKHPGALTRKAKSAGMSPMAFASAHKHSSGTTGRQARLALTLRKLHGSGPISYSDIRQGYKQGRVGAHTDSGMEFAHGRAERAQGKEGTQMGKQPVARQDGGMEGARGKPNQRSEMGRGHLPDPTICRYYDPKQSYAKEFATGRSQKSTGR